MDILLVLCSNLKAVQLFMLLAAFLSILILAHYPQTPSFQPVTGVGGRNHDPILDYPSRDRQQDALQNGTAHGEVKTDIPAS